MDLSSVRNTLEEFLDLSDEMDRNKRGMELITQGANTTRDVFMKELGLFLLNVADEYFYINRDQAEMLDMVMNKGFTYASSDKIKQVVSSISKYPPEDNMSINAYVLSDAMLSYHTGKEVNSGSENMIGMYKLVGMNFVVAGGYQNEAAMNRINRYTAGLESRVPALKAKYSEMVAGAARDAGVAPPPSVSDDGILRIDDEIELEVPEGYIHETETGENDLDRTEWIRYGKTTDDDGNESYEFSASISRIDYTPGEDDDRTPDETPFDVLQRRIGENGKFLPFGKNMAISVKKPLRLFGSLIRYKQVVLAAEVDDDSIATLQTVYIQDEDDTGLDKKNIRHLMKLFGGMRVKGKKCSLTGLDEKKFLKVAHCDFDEDNDESIHDFKVGLKISVNGGEEHDAGEISVSQKPQKANDQEIPEPIDLWDSRYEHLTLVTSGRYTTHRDADFRAQPIRALMEECGATKEKAYKMMEIPGDWEPEETALKLAKVFRMDADRFDPYNDTEALIRKGMFKDVRALHALRSLAWAVEKMTRFTKDGPAGLSFEKLEEIAEKIREKDYLFYDICYARGLTNQYDWHVFYVPYAYMKSSVAETTNLQYLTGKENRGGNSFSIFIPGVSGFNNDISDIISRNEETLESLEDLREELINIQPVMETIHDGLLEGRDRSEPLEGVLAEALAAWCALAVAAKEPFYSEEAADTPEANAGLEGPLERPDDPLDDVPVNGAKPGTKKTVKKPAAKAAAKPAAPAGEVLDLEGETTVKPGQFAGNMSLHHIIIPEGVTEIGERAFYSCMYLETVTLPKSMKKIGKMAFMSCRALNRVEIPEGVEEIEDHAFGATNNLKQLRLPDSLKKVNRTIFGVGGDSPYATAYLSGDLACRLEEEYEKTASFGDALYARHYVIDGKAYESLSDYLADVKSGKVKPEKAAAPDTEAKPAAKKPAAKKTAAKKPAAKPGGEAEAEEKPAAKPAAKKPAAKAGGTKAGGTKTASSSAAKKPKIASATLDPQSGIMISGEHVRACEGAVEMIVPEGVISIGNNAFRDSAVEKIVLPKSLKKIDRWAFHNCKKLKEIELPEGLEAIDACAFEGCSALRDVNLPDSVINLDSSAFSDYGGNKNLAIHLSARMAQRLWNRKKSEPGNPLYGSRFEIDGDYFKSLKEYMDYMEKERQAEAKFAQMDGRKVPVPKPEPAEDDYFRLTETGKGDIAENGVRFDVLRDKGPVIGEHSYIMKLGDTAYLQVPEGVTEIQAGAFAGNKLEVVKLPRSLRILGQDAFMNNLELRKVIFQEGLEQIGAVLFEGCPKMSVVQLPDSMKKAHREAFADELFEETSRMTVHLTGNAARRIYQNKESFEDEACFAKSFVIDGNSYNKISDYILYPKPPVQRSAAPSPASQRSAAPVGNKAGEADRIRGEIARLERERDSVKGLFAGMKRKKIQGQIDELKERLRKL